jgi:hypothetical protein
MASLRIPVNEQNLATPPPPNGEYTLDYMQNLTEKIETAQDFVNVNKYGGELVNMSRHIDSLCKHLDGTAFYASSKSA